MHTGLLSPGSVDSTQSLRGTAPRFPSEYICKFLCRPLPTYRPTGLRPLRTSALLQRPGAWRLPGDRRRAERAGFRRPAGDQKKRVALLDTGGSAQPLFSRLQPSFLISTAAFAAAFKERQDDGGQESAPLCCFSASTSPCHLSLTGTHPLLQSLILVPPHQHPRCLHPRASLPWLCPTPRSFMNSQTATRTLQSELHVLA